MQAAARSLLHYSLLTATLAFLLLPNLTTESSAHGDTTRDLCMARDCATDAVCPMAGADTSYPGVRQSGLWPVHLAALHHLGFDVDGMRGVAFALLLAALLAVALLGEALGTRTAGFAAALTGAVVHLYVGYWVVLWNPSFILLPCTAFFGAVVIANLSRHWLPWLAAAFFLAVAVALHPIAILMGIALPWVLVLRPPKHPIRTILGMFGVALLTVYTFFRDALLALHREVQTGAMSDSLSERSEQLLPTSGIVLGGLLVSAALAILWWLGKKGSGRLGRWLQGPHAALLLACLTPAALALLVLVATDRFYGYRYLVAPLPGLLLVWAPLLGRLGQWLGSTEAASRLTLPLRSWAPPLALLGAFALLPGLSVGGQRPPPRTWSYADGKALADRLVALGVTDFYRALDRVHGPDLPLLMYALRPYLPEVAPGDAEHAAAVVMVVAAPPDDEYQQEWFVKDRADGSALYAAPAAAVFDWQGAQARLLANGEAIDSSQFLPVEIGGFASTYSPWLRPRNGHFESGGRVLQLRLPLLPVEQALRIRPLPDCRCADSHARVIAVDGLPALLQETGEALVESAKSADGPPKIAIITVEWGVDDSCPPLDLEQGGPSLAAWPAANEALGRLLEVAQCP